MKSDVAVVGLGVMGSNLARNLASRGLSVTVFNRTAARTREFLDLYSAEGSFAGAVTPEEMVSSLSTPRRIILMVPAGAATDATIDGLLPLLEPGDVLVDGGNSHYADTRRREAAVSGTGIHFIGAGISGGEEGALKGPAIMVGGPREAYAHIGPLLESIAARVDDEPCCAWMGPDGAGHFVKMVHNGIEYADMQFIAEAYDILLRVGGMTHAQIAGAFRAWNSGRLSSFLMDVAIEVLEHVDALTGRPFLEVVADRAGQKGTGRWTVESSFEVGCAVPTIAASVFARQVSGARTSREAVGAALSRPAVPPIGDGEQLLVDVESALWVSKVVAYAQGLDLIQAASERYGWDVDPIKVVASWRGGCIIRAEMLHDITNAFRAGETGNLLASKFFAPDVDAALPALRRTTSLAVAAGLPIPCTSSAVAYIDSLRVDRLSTSMIQGLRDFFGAHTYERTDLAGSFHTLWSGDRSEVAVG